MFSSAPAVSWAIAREPVCVYTYACMYTYTGVYASFRITEEVYVAGVVCYEAV